MLLLASPAVFGGDNQTGTVASSEKQDRHREKRLVTIENDLYPPEVRAGPRRTLRHFLIKKSNKELVYEGEIGGPVSRDHFAHQGYPGELLAAAYDYAIRRRRQKRRVALRLWTIAKGADGVAADPLGRGSEGEKRIALKAGRREVEVENTFANPTPTGKNVGLWVQQCFCYGGDRLF